MSGNDLVLTTLERSNSKGYKRKEREFLSFDAVKLPKAAAKFPKPASSPTTRVNPAPPDPAPNNLIMAGYLAHEFLTKGTLFGEMWDPGRAERSADAEEGRQRYAEVARLLKADGTHIPGVVNPTQLGRALNL